MEPETDQNIQNTQNTEETPKPFGEKVKIGDQEFVVDKSIAEAITAQQSAFKNEREQIEANVNKRIEEVQSQIQPEKPTEPISYTDLLFSDPDKFVEKIKEDLGSDITKTKQELTNEYKQTEGLKKFWDEFYKENDDLDKKKDDLLVQAVVNQNWSELKDLPNTEASSKIADMTRDVIKGYMSKPKSVKVEGGNTPSPEAPQETPKVTTLSDKLREMKKRRVG